MSGHGLRFAAVLLSILLLAFAASCDGDEDGATPTGSPAATEEPTLTPMPATATAPPDIRQQDLTAQPGLREFLNSAGGEVVAEAIIYVDLTGEGAEEAVVPVSSGGEGGDIAVFVFGYGPTGLQELLRVLPENRSLRADVIDDTLTVTEPVFGPGDPLGRPSELRKTTYEWNGTALVVGSQETVPAEES